MSILDHLLKYSILKKESVFDYDSFNIYLKGNHFIISKYDLEKTIKSTKGFVKFYKSNDNVTVIEIKTNPFSCIGYNSKGGCLKQNECIYLHICLNFLLNVPNCKCKKSHNLHDDFNSRLIAERKMQALDFDLLRIFYEIFFKKKDFRFAPSNQNQRGSIESLESFKSEPVINRSNSKSTATSKVTSNNSTTAKSTGPSNNITTATSQVKSNNSTTAKSTGPSNNITTATSQVKSNNSTTAASKVKSNNSTNAANSDSRHRTRQNNKNKNNNRTIEVEYPSDIFVNNNPSCAYILDIFHKIYNTTSNDIQASRILPDHNKVIITYKNSDLAKSIASRKEASFFDVKFKIKGGKTEDIKFLRFFNTNQLLNLILMNNNNKQIFIDIIKPDENEIKITKKCLIVTPKISPNSSWHSDINKKINAFCSLFKTETLDTNEFSQIETENLIKKIQEKKFSYQLENKKLVIVGLKRELEIFIESESSNIRENSNEKIPIENKSISLPKIHFYAFNSLISLALAKLKLKYNLRSYDLNVKDSLIVLFGNESNIDSAIQSLNHIFNSIKSKRIDNLSRSNILDYSKNLSQLVEYCIKQDASLNDLIFKIQINSSSNSDESGVFLSYFYNCADLNSLDDSVFDRINKHLEQNFTQIVLDVTNHDSILNTPKWRNFEQESFSKSKCSSFFSFCLNKNQNNKTYIYLTGTIDNVIIVQQNINQFFKDNQLVTAKFLLNEIDYNYLTKSKNDFTKYLDSISVKYDFKTFDTSAGITKSYLILNEFSNNFLLPIEKKLKEFCSNKKFKTYCTEALPGINDIINSSLLRADLDIIQSELNCVVNCKLITQSYYKFNPDNNLNQLSKSIQIDTNKLCLEKGSLLNSKVDIIVNSTSSSLDLNTGSLSKMILNAAGSQIRNECLKQFPNGILPDQVAITSAGQCTNIKKIFHIAANNYKDLLSIVNLENLINKCLNKMIEMNMTSISFPSIGTGGFGYPVNLVAEKTFKTCSEFLTKNPTKNLLINIVLYDQDLSAIKAFENEFEMNAKLDTNVSDSFDFLKEAKNKSIAEFEVFYQTESDYVNIVSKIQYLLMEKYMIRDLIEYKYKEIITNQEFEYHLSEFSDLEVKIKNDKINMFGPKEQVLNAKLKLTSLIAENLKNHYSKLETKIRLFKDIQWEYRDVNRNWKPFSLFVNSQIETAYLKKETTLKFINEENVECSIDFKKMKLDLDNKKTYDVNRRNTKEKNNSFFDIIFGSKKEKFSDLSIQYPSNWSEMAESIDFCLVDLKESSSEYLDVVRDFKAKMLPKPVFRIKVQRIQNKTVYEAYLTFKKRFKLKNKNENEMLLYHGTKGAAVDSICRFGFNRSYCGVNGIAYGQGVYFSTTSSYSDSYTYQFDKKMVRARVIVGETTPGDSQMKVPPSKLNGELYDSTCNSNKSILVCYHDNQCYPEYLISYN